MPLHDSFLPISFKRTYFNRDEQIVRVKKYRSFMLLKKGVH